MTQPQPSNRRVSARLVAGGLLVVLAAVFVFENTRRTKIRFIFPQVSAPLWVALVVAMIVGAVIGAVLAWHRASGKASRKG